MASAPRRNRWTCCGRRRRGAARHLARSQGVASDSVSLRLGDGGLYGARGVDCLIRGECGLVNLHFLGTATLSVPAKLQSTPCRNIPRQHPCKGDDQLLRGRRSNSRLKGRPKVGFQGCDAERLRRDSLVDQRIGSSLVVQGFHGCVDGAIEIVVIGEGLVGEMVRLEIAPDERDVVELGRVFWQPFDGKLVLARFEGLEGELADVDRPVVLDEHDGLDRSPWLGAVKMVELLQVSDEVAGALGRARVHGQLARDVIERADHAQDAHQS